MTKEQIEKAATDSLLNDPLELRETSVGTFQQGFITGANWRIESVWHTVEEVPSRNLNGNHYGELCLVITRDGNIDFAQACYEDINGVYYFKTYSGLIELHNVKKWAYIKDLIPEEKKI